MFHYDRGLKITAIDLAVDFTRRQPRGGPYGGRISLNAQRLGLLLCICALRFSMAAFFCSADEGKAGDVREAVTAPMKLRYCPPGKFLMGSRLGTNVISRGDGTDKRQWDVTLSEGFWIGQTEVTQKQWLQVMKTEPWKVAGSSNAQVGESLPAVMVSWHEACTFCKSLTEQERQLGKLTDKEEYRLPSEAEWEYACRAGAGTEYSFGETPEKLSDYAWFSDNSNRIVRPVGQKKSNAWDVYDMHGNAWEWCFDWYADIPMGGVDPQGPDASNYKAKVYRGGSVASDPLGCRSASRFRIGPGTKNRLIGFRVVLAPVVKKS